MIVGTKVCVVVTVHQRRAVWILWVRDFNVGPISTGFDYNGEKSETPSHKPQTTATPFVGETDRD